MAWTGIAVVKKVNSRTIRITGLSLAADALGTIGFQDQVPPAPDVELPLLPNWQSKGFAHLGKLIEARYVLTTDVTVAVPISVSVVGDSQLNCQARFHNDSAADASGLLEIWIIYSGGGSDPGAFPPVVGP